MTKLGGITEWCAPPFRYAPSLYAILSSTAVSAVTYQRLVLLVRSLPAPLSPRRPRGEFIRVHSPRGEGGAPHRGGHAYIMALAKGST